MLVAIAFLSLPVSHINGAFHRVEFVQARLSSAAQLSPRFALRADGAGLLRHLRLAVHRAGALVLAVWRPCADLPGDAALAAAIAAGDRHGGAVPVARCGRWPPISDVCGRSEHRPGTRWVLRLQVLDRHRPVSRPAHGRDAGAVCDHDPGGDLPAPAGRDDRRSTASAS